MANAIGYASGGKSYHELAYSGEQQSATREKRGTGTNKEERQTAEHQAANHRLEAGKREEWRDRENSSHREKNKGLTPLLPQLLADESVQCCVFICNQVLGQGLCLIFRQSLRLVN